MNEIAEPDPQPPTIGKETKVSVTLGTLALVAFGGWGAYEYDQRKADVAWVNAQIEAKDAEYQQRFAASEAQNNRVYAETYVRARIIEILKNRCRTGEANAFSVSLSDWLRQYKALTGDDFNLEANRQC